ncbi:MAG TPA: AmpG family muropeptide MFS transporter [Bacteroidota bacterium]|nr:AmpG family muropeptide MFS transporter [Bacteroidota bacterium]
MDQPERRNPWLWVPSLYFAEGLPYVIVLTVSVIMYKRFGISNTDIALYTSLLYLPWVIKPLWGPVVDLVRTKRFWIVTMQVVIALALAAVALAISLPGFFVATLAVFWLMAFSSATHDIAADGFYMLGLREHEQAAFVGVRSTFYRIAMVTGQGLLVVVAGTLETSTGGNTVVAWSVTFGILAAMFLLFFLYHRFMLPYPASDTRAAVAAPGAERSPAADFGGNPLAKFFEVFAAFFRKPRMGATLAFLLLYRLAESQLIKMVSPFLLDPRSKGGLGLTTSEVGIVYGTVGIAALTLGGLVGGFVIPRRGLRFWLWPMVVVMHLPDLVFVYLSHVQPESFLLINVAVAVEQFGYGFGFTAYMLYMIMVSEGEHKTAHYALCTGFMALGMMLPGMASGAIQEWLGYPHFYVWVMLSTIPGFIVTALISIDKNFGKKSEVEG